MLLTFCTQLDRRFAFIGSPFWLEQVTVLPKFKFSDRFYQDIRLLLSLQNLVQMYWLSFWHKRFTVCKMIALWTVIGLPLSVNDLPLSETCSLEYNWFAVINKTFVVILKLTLWNAIGLPLSINNSPLSNFYILECYRYVIF